MKVTKSILQALLIFAGKKDVRHQLNAGYFDQGKGIATNGHILIEFDIDDESELSALIHRDDLNFVAGLCRKSIDQNQDNCVYLSLQSDGKFKFDASNLFAESSHVNDVHDIGAGTYPIVDKVFPKDEVKSTVSVNPDYLIALGRAAKALKEDWVTLLARDPQTALEFRLKKSNARGLIMPMRTD